MTLIPDFYKQIEVALLKDFAIIILGNILATKKLSNTKII